MWQPRRVRRLPALRRRAALIGSALVALAAVVGACSGSAGGQQEAERPPLRVAASDDVEATLLAHVIVALLEADELPAKVRPYADARDAQQALELGAVEIRPGYTGEAWLESLGRADPPGDPEASFRPVRVHGERRGIRWLPPRFAEEPDGPPANATFAFAVAGPPSPDADLRTVSQLAARLSERPDASVCVDREFGSRPDGLRAVLEAYRVRSDRQFLAATPDEAVRGVVAGDCLAGLTTATDGQAGAAGLQLLVDDLEVFPAFVPAVQVREDAIERWPELPTVLAPLGEELTTAMLRGYNARLVAGEPVEVVASEAAEELRARAAARQDAAEGTDGETAEDAGDAEGTEGTEG